MESRLTSLVKDKGISSHLDMIWGAWSFPRFAILKKYSYRLGTVVSGNLCSFLKEVKPLVLYAVETRIAMEPMKGNGLHLELIHVHRAILHS